jgi:seryl-tRNA synthetase
MNSTNKTSGIYDEKSFNNSEDNVQLIQPTESELEEFKQQFSEWIKMDDQIRKLEIAMKERKTHKKALEKKVCEFMTKFKYDNLNTKHGQIKCNIKMIPQPVKYSKIKTTIFDSNMSPDEIIKGLKNMIVSDVPKVKKENLRRIMPKVSMNLDL